MEEVEDVDTADGAPDLEPVVQAMAKYLSVLLSTRCSVFVQQANHLRWIEHDPPAYDPARPLCQSCGKRCEGRVLCDGCRRKPPRLYYGPTVVDTMYRSSNPKYELDDEKKGAILELKRHMGFAYDSLALAKTLAGACWHVHQQHAADPAHRTPNVRFDLTVVSGDAHYAEAVACGRATRVVVGGLGRALRDDLRARAYEWLQAVDRTIRAWFDIPVTRDDDDDASVSGLQRALARQIANRVALLEPHDDDPTKRLDHRGLKHTASVQHHRCQLFARAAADRDIAALRALLVLARGDADHADDGGKPRRSATLAAIVRHRLDLIRLLGCPPPELRRLCAKMPVTFEFDRLRDVLGDQHSYTPQGMAAAAGRWRVRVGADRLCALVEQIIRAIQLWEAPRGSVIEVVHPMPLGAAATTVHGGGSASHAPAEARLPEPPWAQSRTRWQLVPRLRHASRRTGLDPPGLRIVLLCSVVQRMLAEEAEAVLEPGVVAAAVLSPLATASAQRCFQAYQRLREEMHPLTIGVAWSKCQEQIDNWPGSHIEDSVREAARHLSCFSYDQLAAVFGTEDAPSPVGDCPRFVQAVRELLVFKPKRGYDTYASAALKFALPVLRRHRQSLGVADAARSDPVGDLLRLHPTIRAWRPGHGPLRLTRRALRGAPPELRRMLDHMCEQSRLVCLRRPPGASAFQYCFSTPDLLRALSGV